MNMLHHISFPVSNLELSIKFYDAVMAVLGYRCVFKSKTFVGYGIESGKDKFSIVHKTQEIIMPVPGFHLAFSAQNRKSVDDFFAAAINNGGKGNGNAGLRPEYGPHYYAAFVIDPDGYYLEAVINVAI